MNGQELKEALMQESAVVFNGIKYSKVSGIIYRKVGNGVAVSAELLDRNRNSVVIAASDKIRLAGE